MGTMAQLEESFKRYETFDFIPGEKIIYYTDFMRDTLNKFPPNWITNSPGEVIYLHKYQGMNWLKLNLGSTNSTGGKIMFEENTTVEFDLIAKAGKDSRSDNTEIQVYFHSQLPDELFADYVPGSGGFCFRFLGEKVTTFSWKNQDYTDVNGDFFTTVLDSNKNTKIHFSINIQKTNVRLYINQYKIVDMPDLAPNDIPPLDRISFFSNGTNFTFSLLLTNLCVKTGIPDNKTKMEKSGKFSTTGIKFISGTDTIRSESYAVLKDVANIINENPLDARFKIVCYTDDEGDDALNMTLSQKRAESVKKALVGVFKLESKNLSTEGKGENSPVNNNLTNEEKASNRRIEIIKL